MISFENVVWPPLQSFGRIDVTFIVHRPQMLMWPQTNFTSTNVTNFIWCFAVSLQASHHWLYKKRRIQQFVQKWGFHYRTFKMKYRLIPFLTDNFIVFCCILNMYLHTQFAYSVTDSFNASPTLHHGFLLSVSSEVLVHMNGSIGLVM